MAKKNSTIAKLETKIKDYQKQIGKLDNEIELYTSKAERLQDKVDDLYDKQSDVEDKLDELQNNSRLAAVRAAAEVVDTKGLNKNQKLLIQYAIEKL